MLGMRHNLDYSQITEQIYVGNNQCCQVHFEEELLSKQITADISLEEERMDAASGVDSMLWLPTVDHTPPSQDQLLLGVEHIRSLVALGKKVYVHCKNGHGRAPTLTAAYLVSTGQSVDEAIETIRHARPSIHPEDSQIQALHVFAKRFRFEKT